MNLDVTSDLTSSMTNPSPRSLTPITQNNPLQAPSARFSPKNTGHHCASTVKKSHIPRHPGTYTIRRKRRGAASQKQTPQIRAEPVPFQTRETRDLISQTHQGIQTLFPGERERERRKKRKKRGGKTHIHNHHRHALQPQERGSLTPSLSRIRIEKTLWKGAHSDTQPN